MLFNFIEDKNLELSQIDREFFFIFIEIFLEFFFFLSFFFFYLVFFCMHLSIDSFEERQSSLRFSNHANPARKLRVRE